MTQHPRQRLRTLFAQAAELPQRERGEFLDAACQGEPELRAEVEELLAYDSVVGVGKDAEGFLKSPLVRAGARTQAESPMPRLLDEPALPPFIGRYRILRRHGEGGMGIVYEAEQDNPRRTVALKVIHPGFIAPELLKRFSHEARILARLQHPGIAQVHEAGMSEDGRPFFAMEFISGAPLDEYARGLDATARLELLARVCDAVQHAHDKGVIHRDLKPGNILVDDSGQPKVLDFGVAHVTDADFLTTASQTQTGQLLGTLSYMSPEQITANPHGLDKRSDVYTLGVLLFELLTQRLPYHLDHLPVHEVARVIQHEEPSRLGSINALYRGDVEIIVAKALEKDRSRRYASAGDLASDVRRYLRGDPILARPASALYQVRKFARRNKSLVAAVSGILASLFVGTIVSIVFAVRAQDSARVARNNALAAQENARLANERERVATSQSYLARIAAGVAALSRHDVADAAHQLDAAPPTLRGWEWRHLRTRLDDSTAVFPASSQELQYLIRDSKGPRIVFWSPVSLRLADLEGHELLSSPFQPEGPLMDLGPIATRHGLRFLAWAGGRREPNPILNLLDEQGRVHAQLKGPPGNDAPLVAVSPDGSRVALIWIGPKAWIFTVHDLDSGRQGATSAQNLDYTWAIVFSPDGTHLATAGEDGLTRLWDASTGKLTAESRGHSRKVLKIAFRPDGKRFVTTSADGTIRQWDSTTGREVEPPYDRHSGEVMAAEYSPDGLWIASGGTDRTVRIWNAANRQDLAVLHGHTGVVTDLAFMPDGRRVVSVSRLKRLGYAGDGTARLWEVDLQAGRAVLRGHSEYVYPVAYSPDGQWIASGSWDQTARLWDAVTGESRAILPHPGRLRSLAFSPDGTRLYTGCDQGESLQVWDVATAQRRKDFKGPGGIIQALATSPDGAHVAAVDLLGSVITMDAATGARIHSVPMSGRPLDTRPLAYSPDGRFLASVSEDGTRIDVRDARTHQRSAQLAGHTGVIYSVAWSSDGRLLASASGMGDLMLKRGDFSVRVWDVALSKCETILTGHTDEVFALAFHPDGQRLASAGRDRAIWLWDLATGQETARLEGHTNYVMSLAFSPDGTSLASGSGDGTVRIWDTETPALRHQARREAETLRPEAERLVKELFQAKKDNATEVAAAVRADRSLSEPQKHAALRAILSRSAKQSPDRFHGD